MSKKAPTFMIDQKLKDYYEICIEATLPICLYLDDQVLEIKIGRRIAKIEIKRIENTKHKLKNMIQIPNGGDIRVNNVRENPFSRTAFRLFFKPTIHELERFAEPDSWQIDPFTERSLDPLYVKGLEFINKLIKNYRYYANEPALSALTPWEIESFKLLILLNESNFQKKRVIFNSKNLSAKGIMVISGNKFNNKDIERDLIKSLKSESGIHIWVDMLLNSRSLYLRGEFNQSIIEAFSSLEFFLQFFIKNKFMESNVSEDEINKKMKRASTEFLLGKLMHEAVGTRFKEISKKIWKEFNECKKNRNFIIHRGDKASRKESHKTILVVNSVISELNKI